MFANVPRNTENAPRRTTKGTQFEEDNNEDEESTEAERRNRNSEIKVKVRGRNLVEEGGREESGKERITHISFHFFFMCPVASNGSNSLVAVSPLMMAITSEEGIHGPSSPT